MNAAANPAPFTASDLAWASGGLYATDDAGQLHSIDVATGRVTDIGTADATGGVLGAQFGFTDGLFGAANDGSGYYQINLATGQRTRLSTAPPATSNDGANCPLAAFAAVKPAPAPIPTLGHWALMLLAEIGRAHV